MALNPGTAPRSRLGWSATFLNPRPPGALAPPPPQSALSLRAPAPSRQRPLTAGSPTRTSGGRQEGRKGLANRTPSQSEDAARKALKLPGSSPPHPRHPRFPLPRAGPLKAERVARIPETTSGKEELGGLETRVPGSLHCLWGRLSPPPSSTEKQDIKPRHLPPTSWPVFPTSLPRGWGPVAPSLPGGL